MSCISLTCFVITGWNSCRHTANKEFEIKATRKRHLRQKIWIIIFFICFYLHFSGFFSLYSFPALFETKQGHFLKVLLFLSKWLEEGSTGSETKIQFQVSLSCCTCVCVSALFWHLWVLVLHDMVSRTLNTLFIQWSSFSLVCFCPLVPRCVIPAYSHVLSRTGLKNTKKRKSKVQVPLPILTNTLLLLGEWSAVR